MLNNMLTVTEVAAQLQVGRKKVLNVAPLISGAKKVPNDKKVLCWVFPPQSVAEIGERIRGEYQGSPPAPETPEPPEPEGGQEDSNPPGDRGGRALIHGPASTDPSKKEQPSPKEEKEESPGLIIGLLVALAGLILMLLGQRR